MPKKIFSILVSMLFICTIISVNVFAGSEEDPEIIDNEDDLFGALVNAPYRLRSIIALKMLGIESFEMIDLKSAWIFENENEPEYLFAAVKINDLQFIKDRAIYSVHWKFNNIKYGVGSHAYSSGETSCFVGVDRSRRLYESEVEYDLENNIVTFKFLKVNIGDPQPGDMLTNTYAWTAIRFFIGPLSLLFSDGELVKDAAPFIEDNEDYGRDYIIQY